MGRRSSKLLFPAVAVILQSLVACSDSGGLSVSKSVDADADSNALANGHTAHTDITDGIWPPRPAGVSNVESYPSSARAGAELGVIDTARRTLMLNPETLSAIGDNFRQFDGSLGDSKGDVTASFLFYNYDNNTTVEAHLTRSGDVTSNVYPAAEWQPPEHTDEVSEAIALGQASLAADGFETAGLTGTAMLAFPQINQITGTQQHYYPERMLYVTFGDGDGEIPIYSALVNLSSGAVTESGLVK